MINDDGSALKSALLKCAVGFSTSETVEEYAAVDGELMLVKRKVTNRDVPPDIKAVKMLLEDDDLSTLSTEQLLEQKERLLKLLKDSQN